MKKTVIAILALVVVLVGAVLVGPSFVDWNSYKPEIAAAVEQRTGRKLAIDGAIGFQVLPSPSLSVEKVRLSNAAGATDKDFLQLDSLQVHVALMPLLEGRVQIASVTLRRPVVALERLADGRNNWTFETAAPAGQPAAGAAAGEEASGTDFQLDGARIVDGTVIFRDKASGAEHRVERLNAQVSAESLSGPFKLRADLSYGGVPMVLTTATGKMAAGKSTPLEVILRVAEKAAEVGFSGSAVLDGGGKARGTLTVKSADLAAGVRTAASAAGTAADLPAAFAKPFSFSGEVEADAKAATVERIKLALGETQGQGRILARLDGTPRIEAKLDINRLSLDELLAVGAAAGTKPAAAAAPAGTAQPAAFALPGGFEAAVNLTAEAVDYRGGVIRQAHLEAGLKDGIADIAALSAQLPGGSDVSLSGKLDAAGGKPRFAGRADFVSDNLRAALAWLGADVDGIAPDRLRKGVFGADVRATPEEVQLTNWIMDLDTTKVRGGLTLLLRERPAFGLTLDVDRINLDAYLPPEPAKDAAKPAPAAASAAPAAGPDLAALIAGFDANVRLKVGEASWRQTALRDASLDATVQNGGITVRDLSVADLGGAAITVSGALAGTVAAPSTRLNFDIDAKSAARLARLAGIEPTETLQRVGAFTVKGTLLGDLADMTLDAEAKALGGTLGVKGVVQPLAQPVGLDLAIRLEHGEAKRLVLTLAPEAVPANVRLGKLMVASTVTSRPDQSLAIETAIDLDAAQLKLKGTVKPYTEVPELALDLGFSHPDAVALVRSFAPDFKPSKRDLGPASFAARLAGTTKALEIGGLDLDVGPAAVDGAGSVDLSGARPRLKLALAAKEILVDPWLPADAPRPKAGAGAVVPVKQKSREWSREPIDSSALASADAELAFKAEKIVYGGYVLDAVDLAAKLEAGTLSLAKFDSGLFGGTISGTGEVKHGEATSAALALTVKNADVRQAAMSAAGMGDVTGRLDYETQLRTQGRSEFDLVSKLQGTGKLLVRDGTVEGFDLPAVSKQLDQLDRSADFLVLAQRAMQGGKTPFQSLSATYTVTDGVLRSEDIALKATAAEGKGTAVVNLPPQELDAQLRFWLTEHPNSPPIGVRMVGPLDNPRQVLDMEKMQAYVLQRLVERGLLRQLNKGKTETPAAGTATPQAPSAAPTQPVESQPVKPEDAVKGILKGLLGN